ncbi:MAG: helix-turn-helix domain-containing protein [Bacteroidetes bacterium]|nr:helix-turn-helix domain-containing protein [Bacteroidota bacterium]
MFLKQFGKHLKKIREDKGITQFEVCCRINKDRQSLQRIESGNSNPTIYYLYELAIGLDVPLKMLTDFTHSKKDSK